MPNIDMLIDTVSQHLTNTQKGEQAYFPTLDRKYAYSPLQLHKDTAKHCNFIINCGESTGTIDSKQDSTVPLTCWQNSKKQSTAH